MLVVLYQDLPVFADVYQLTLRIFAVTREYKFTLGQDMKRDALALGRGRFRVGE